MDLKRILVVDDEEDLTWSIAKSLEKNDKLFEVFCVNNGDTALAVLASQRVDLVISDLRMPGRDGLSLLVDIQRNYPATRVIVMTAHSSEDLRQELARRGSRYCLEKPFDLRYLRKLIYEALDWEKGNFAADPQGVLSQRTIRAGWQTLLDPQ
jgi:two-component system nitrogen regulation response regulator GlnG